MKFKLTETSSRLINLITDIKECNLNLFQEEEESTKKVFIEFYNHFVNAEKYYESKKFIIEIKKIPEIKDIPKPSDFHYIIKPIQDKINSFSKFSYRCSFELGKRIININLISDKNDKN